jgi:16S rRNA (guanine(966)-N(2))-methyltransferase RsmD
METRPTADRLRETLFNVLTSGNPSALEDTAWLDLYAGTGAVGIEALSRGARMVYFVDSSAKAADTIRENLRSLGITEGFEVQEREVLRCLRLLDSEAVACDFVFLDPPYRDRAAYADALSFLSTSRLIAPESRVICEHPQRFDPGGAFGALRRVRRVEQGDSALSFYRLE